MRKECVEHLKWFTENEFLDLIGATQLIPGPNSTELAIHIGKEKGGRIGLVLAGIAFIFPAVILTLLIAYFYQTYGKVPSFQSFFYGVPPVLVGVILAAIAPLSQAALKSNRLAVFGLIALILVFLNVSEWVVLFGIGIMAVILHKIQTIKNEGLSSITLLGILPKLTTTSLNSKLFFTFLKIGATLYGSGYVLFAFIDKELVQTGILKENVLIDAIAIGQFTPGPVFSAVTFVGFQINGIVGALLSTLAVFLPSFILIAAIHPLLKLVKHSNRFRIFIDAVNVASVAIIIRMCFTMSIPALVDWKTTVLLCLGILVSFGFPKINSATILLGASLVGFFLKILQ